VSSSTPFTLSLNFLDFIVFFSKFKCKFLVSNIAVIYSFVNHVAALNQEQEEKGPGSIVKLYCVLLELQAIVVVRQP